MKNYYRVLGIGQDASNTEVERAYNILSNRYDPNKNKGNKYAEEKFIDISVAYKTLSDEEKRAEYDRILKSILSGPQYADKGDEVEERSSSYNGRTPIYWAAGVIIMGAVCLFIINNVDWNSKSDISSNKIIDEQPLSAIVKATVDSSEQERSMDALVVPNNNIAVKKDSSVVLPKKSDVPKGAVSVSPETATVKVEPSMSKPHISIGVGKKEALEIQGTPEKITKYDKGELWHYGKSTLFFKEGKVASIRNLDNNLVIESD